MNLVTFSAIKLVFGTINQLVNWSQTIYRARCDIIILKQIIKIFAPTLSCFPRKPNLLVLVFQFGSKAACLLFYVLLYAGSDRSAKAQISLNQLDSGYNFVPCLTFSFISSPYFLQVRVQSVSQSTVRDFLAATVTMLNRSYSIVLKDVVGQIFIKL